MKRKGLKTAVCLMTGTVLMSSCVGSFAMFNKLASWNKRATDSKFLNELIFIVISPAYALRRYSRCIGAQHHRVLDR